MTKAHLRLLRENYEKACNAYLLALANMWGWCCQSYGYWVGNDVGSVYSYGDGTFINLDDIIYCVENSISEERYNEWVEYCMWAHEFRQDIPNLKSWNMGCPIVDKETRERLSKMKAELDTAIKETKEKF